jgi:hypothetical protein
MRFAVIGHPCVDEIHTLDGRVIRSWGGVIYSLAAMAALARKGDIVVPAFCIGAGEAAAFGKRIERFGRLDRAALGVAAGTTNTIVLRYISPTERTEHCPSVLPPLDFAFLAPRVRSADGILVNMISGFDVTIETLAQLRASTAAPIHLDVHSLVLGELKPDSPRAFAPVAGGLDWFAQATTAQLNEHEAGIFTPECGDEASLAAGALARGLRALLVTRGERGVSVYTSDAGTVRRADLPPASAPEEAIDSTGCGDVFGGAFAVAYARDPDAVGAARAASVAAAANARFSGSEQIEELSAMIVRLRAADA